MDNKSRESFNNIAKEFKSYDYQPSNCLSRNSNSEFYSELYSGSLRELR